MSEDYIGAVIFIGRSMKGWSRAGLARRCKVSRAYISQIEKGYKHPNSKLLIKIAQELGTTIEGMFHLHSTARMVFEQKRRRISQPEPDLSNGEE